MSMRWLSLRLFSMACVAGGLLPAAAEAGATAGVAPLEEVVVTASLLGQTSGSLPVSVTVLPEAVLRAAGQQHFADVLALVPNLNWSGGTSRPRFFQLRGIGELEQYQGAPNPSVGFLIDALDFSGIGMAATMLDVEQVEVLRGPQGTRYGANALAGLIKLKTHDPSTVPTARLNVDAGDDAMHALGIVLGGPLTAMPEGSAWRLTVQNHVADGYRRNVWLERHDTNRRDESTVRGKLRLRPSEAWTVDLTGLYVDVDNGFDAFSPDNRLRTLSDRPGRDAQRSLGGSVVADGGAGDLMVHSETAYVDSRSLYSFDGDWGNDPYWGEYAPYDYFSRYGRERRTLTQDLRLTGGDDATTEGDRWVVGAYFSQLQEAGVQRDFFAAELLRSPLKSDYSAASLALYAEGQHSIGHGLVVDAGLRLERRRAEYRDSDANRFAPTDTMWGGNLSVRGALGGDSDWYATVSRGYKAGGFNIGAAVPAERRQFAPELLWNVEAGLRRADSAGRLLAEISMFHMWREQQQVSTSFQLDPGDPLSYVFFTDNAARGRNYGLEASLRWRASAMLELGAAAGVLGSRYIDYRYGERNLDGRAQAHAPSWQYAVSAQWGSERGWLARVDLNGTDAFYFDASHDQRSRPAHLLNLKAGYGAERWSLYGWVRNAADARQAVRGFYFGLEPPDYLNKTYVQLGDPRHAGVTIEWRVR